MKVNPERPFDRPRVVPSEVEGRSRETCPERSRRIDLHLHSYFSDGILSPTKLVENCKKSGLEIVALTDHETISGIQEALRAGERLDILVIPGIEISVNFEGKEHHLLGYFSDSNWQNQQLEIFLDYWRRQKIEQIKEMLEKLQELGFTLSFEEVLKFVKGSIGRSHLGLAVFENPANREILRKSGVADKSEFFQKFLRTNGLAYVDRERPSVQNAIGLVKRIGGLIVWAHPFSSFETPDLISETAEVFKDFGLDGLEIIYPMHNQAQTSALHQIAVKLGLIETLGSDFHSPTGKKFNKIAGFETFGLKIDFSWVKEKFGGKT